MKQIYDFAPTAQFPRHSEGAFIRLQNGNIMFVYSRFCDGCHDYSVSDIVATEFSPDGEQYLGKERVLFTTEQFGAANVMCPSLLRIDGELLLFFLVRKDEKHGGKPQAVLTTWLFRSHDDGMTFDNGIECTLTDEYLVVENDRVIVTSSGAILFAASRHPAKQGSYAGVTEHADAIVFYRSEDNGKSFRVCQIQPTPDEISSGLQEPGLCEFADGKIMAYTRTDAGQQWLAYSEDDGRSYTEFAPSTVFLSPRSPMSVKRLSDGRFLAVYNHQNPNQTVSPDSWGRTPLVYRTATSFVQNDDGSYSGNWSEPVAIETSPECGFCYTAIFSDKDVTLLAYCAGSKADGICLNRLRIVKL